MKEHELASTSNVYYQGRLRKAEVELTETKEELLAKENRHKEINSSLTLLDEEYGNHHEKHTQSKGW